MRKWILFSSIALIGILAFAIIVMRNDQVDSPASVKSAAEPSPEIGASEEAEQTSNQSESAPTKPLTAEERLARLEKLTDDFAEKHGFLQSRPTADLSQEEIQPEMLLDDDFPTRRATFLELENQIMRSDGNSDFFSRPDDVIHSLRENLLGNTPEFTNRASALLYALSLQSAASRVEFTAPEVGLSSPVVRLAISISNDPRMRDALLLTLKENKIQTLRGRAAESLSYFFGYSVEVETALSTVLGQSDDADLNASIAQSLWSMYRPEYSSGAVHDPSNSAIRALTRSLGKCNFRNCSATLEIIGSARPQFALTKLVLELATAENQTYFASLAHTISKYESLPAQTVDSLKRLHTSETDAIRKSVIGNILADNSE